MKRLLDQNLSYKLVAKLEHFSPGTTQARLLGMAQATDTAIWQYAADNGFTMVTKDAGFTFVTPSHFRASPRDWRE